MSCALKEENMTKVSVPMEGVKVTAVPAETDPDQVMGENGDEVNGDFDFDSEELDDEDGKDSKPGEENDDEDEDSIMLSEDDISEDDGSDEEGGVPVVKGRALSPSAALPLLNPLDEDATILSTSAAATDLDPTPINPQRPTPYIHDAGLLMVTDPNPLPKTTASTLEATLAANARDAAQSLLNHLLTTCPIHTAPITSASSSGVTMSLPPPEFHLPREKKIPEKKPPTTWEKFAARKGIGMNNKKGGVGKDGQLNSTEGKMVYDEATGEWVPKWGYKGKNKKGEGEWLVEVDDKKEARTGENGDARAESRAARKQKVVRNERLQRANERRARKGKSSS